MFKRFNILLTEPQYNKLKNESKRIGISITEVVRRILDHYLNIDKKE